jgi:hypothetical protein
MEAVSREANGNSFLSADTGQLALHATNATVSQQALGRCPFHETERVWMSCSRYEVLETIVSASLIKGSQPGISMQR